MILPLALHLYVPSFCLMHMDFEAAPKAIVAAAIDAKTINRFMLKILNRIYWVSIRTLPLCGLIFTNAIRLTTLKLSDRGWRQDAQPRNRPQRQPLFAGARG